jgi:FkbM family methyltransferase
MKRTIKWIFGIISYILGNKIGQRFLEQTLVLNAYLMGIGSGSGVNNSGEEIIFKKLLKIKPDNFTVFDVGANQGQFLNLAIRMLKNRTFDIHSFEPSKYTFDILLKNKPENINAHLNNFGLGENEATMILHYDDYASGLASLSKRNLEFKGIDFGKVESVLIRKLDNYCKESGIHYIDLLKIDVEGHEMDVLTGAIGLITNKKIGMISFEFGGCNIDTKTYFKDFYYFMNKNGFATYRITPSGYCFRISNYQEIYEQFRTTNYLSILKG